LPASATKTPSATKTQRLGPAGKSFAFWLKPFIAIIYFFIKNFQVDVCQDLLVAELNLQVLDL
jgi:hypothetical protein